MLPLLNVLKDGKEWAMKDLTDQLADEFELTIEEREELLPSGPSRVLVNRVAWAKTYLKEAGLVAPVRRGVIKITATGSDVIKANPNRIDDAYLRQFPPYLEFRNREGRSPMARKRRATKSDELSHVGDSVVGSLQTPEDSIEEAYRELRDALADEILQQVLEMSDKFFERLVVDLLVAIGYGGSIEEAGKTVGRSGDGGIDGIIKEDKLGLDVIVIQAKRYTTNAVGRPDIQSFAGSMEAQRASKGVFITTSSFSAPAQDYVKQIQRKIVLIDGENLTNLMIDYGVGVSPYKVLELKRLDSDYFQE